MNALEVYPPHPTIYGQAEGNNHKIIVEVARENNFEWFLNGLEWELLIAYENN